MQDDTLPLGTALDAKWRIEALLGQGGMGCVYAATHVRNQNRVAVKVLHRELARDAALRDRFLHEGYAANQVGHPGTVRVLDDGSTPDGHTYLVMERLEGQPLDAVADAAGGKLPVADVLRYSLAILDVIAAAHDKGIVHRDLKPENFFLCRDGSLKVLDFGIAQVKEAQTKARLTVTGVPMGTPAFMPPEQALAHWERVDAHADVYSIGATMANLLTGKLLHDARSLPELLVAVSTRPAPPIQSLAPDVPPAVAAVIDRALAFEPNSRWPNARAMAQALTAAAAGHHARPTLVSGHAPAPSVALPAASPARRPSDEPSAATFRSVASNPDPRLIAVQTAAPVSSSSRDTARRRAQTNGWLLAVGAFLGLGIAGGAAFYFVTSAPTVQTNAASGGGRPAADTRTADPPTTAGSPAPEASVAPAASLSASAASQPLATASAEPTAKVSASPGTKTNKPPKPPPPQPTGSPAPPKTAPNPLDFN